MALAVEGGGEPDGGALNFFNLLTMTVLVLNGQRGPVETMQETFADCLAKMSLVMDCLSDPVGFVLGDPLPGSWPLTTSARFERPPVLVEEDEEEP